ncbi:24833_t:CDS:2, partial [Gigaspora margarita]
MEPQESQPKLGKELKDLKERIEAVALNYTALTNKIKTIKERPRQNYYQDPERRIVYNNCGKIDKNVNFCEIIYDDDSSEKEVYNVGSGATPQKKLNEQEQKRSFNPNPEMERSNITNKKKGRCRPLVIDSLSPYNVTEDILALPTTVTVGQMLQYPNQRRNLAQVLKRLLTTSKANFINVEEKKCTTGARCCIKIQGSFILAGLKWYKEEEEYNSEGGDTFDEFNYEEDEKIEEVEGCFIKEYYNENPALFLTNIIEVPIEEKEKKNLVELKIQKIIKNVDLTFQQKQEVEKFLLNKKGMFAQGLENLGHTEIIIHVINTGDAVPINQSPYKAAHGE